MDKPKNKPRGKPFLPGNNANPKGRPRNPDCLVACLRKVLAKPVNGTTVEQRIADKLADMAMAGDMKAIALTFEYTAVKPKQEFGVIGSFEIRETEVRLSDLSHTG